MKLDIQMFSYYDGDVVVKVKADTGEFEKGLDKIEDSTKKASSSVKNVVLGLGISKIISKGFSAITSSMDDAIKRFDTLQNFPKVMSNLGIGVEDAQKSIDTMSEALAGLPTTLDQGAMAVQRFTSKNNDVKKSTDIFLALNNAILAGGAGTEIQASALEQLSQSYSKGKMDMMEWRTVQMAMPAQLKQVATAMGVTTDQLGVMLREGDNTAEVMDEFMETIIKLNKEGINGFASFEKQAKNSTGGIRTSITIAKTQVVKGVASMIEGINKGLKKSKLPSLSEIIANIGKEAKKHLDNIGKALSKIDFKKVADTIKNLLPVLGSLVAGFVAYNTAIKAINMVNMIKNFASLVNPIGLVTASVAALAAGLIYLTTQESAVDKTLREANETLQEYEDSMAEVDKRREENLSKSMNEIYYYQSLRDELKGIVDENGKVKEGYEDRANFIVNELNNALGLEITMTDGIIDNYTDIQGEIDKTLEKKKAMAYFNAHEEEYNEALKNEAKLQKEITKNVNNRKEAEENLSSFVETIAKEQNLSVNTKKELIKYLKGEIEYTNLSAETMKAYDIANKNHLGLMDGMKNKYKEFNDTVNRSTKDYAKNQETIEKYRKAEEELAQGHYETVQKIFNDTVVFNGKTKEENDKKYEESKASWEEYRKFLNENQDKYSKEFLDKEQQRIDEELKKLDEERESANNKIKESNQQLLTTTVTGINDRLKAMEVKNVEFKDAGNGHVDMYVNGFREKQNLPLEEAERLTNDVSKKIKNGDVKVEDAGSYLINSLALGIMSNKPEIENGIINIVNSAIGILQKSRNDTYSSGNWFVQGFADGIESNAGVAQGAASRMGSTVLSTMKNVLGIASPSKITKMYGKYFTEGFDIGLENGKKDTLKDVRQYGEDILKELNKNDFNSALNNIYGSMQRAVDIETGKISSNVELGNVSKNISQTINASASFEGTIPIEVDLDGEKVWQNQQKISQRKSLQYGGVR